MMDHLAWFRNKKDIKVIEHLKGENTECENYFKPLEALQQKIYNEILTKIKEDDQTVPYPKGGFEYYSETYKGKAYKSHLRRDILTKEPEVLIDENELAAGHNFFDLSFWDVSPNESLLAYSIDTVGDEDYTIFIKNLSTQEVLKETISKAEGSFVWSADSTTLYYITLDSANRPYRVWKHIVGMNIPDELLYEENNEACFVDIYRSKDDKYLFLDSSSKVSSEVFYLDLENPLSQFKSLVPRKPDVLYSAEHHKGMFIILTNDEAVNFEIRTIDVAQLKAKKWTTLISHEPTRRILDIDVFSSHLVLYERRNGLTHFRVYHWVTKTMTEISFPESSYFVEPDFNVEYETSVFRFAYESPIRPDTTIAFNLSSQKQKILKTSEIPGGFDTENYSVEYTFAPSHDQTLIPITLYYRKGFQKNGAAPLLLTGYGAYEISREPYFQRSHFSLLDRGFAIAIPHVRGGGENGRTWYEAGKLLNKKNTFLDFIACAEFLISQKITKAQNIAISGGSAGGLLMGVVTNARPDLWGAVVALVPFMDVINTMSDPTLPLTVTEYDEWGNPENPVYRKYILSYSPYDNVINQEYPPILATGGLNDPRVGFWEPAKWVEKIKQMRTNKETLLLKTDLESGHAGPSGRYAKIKEQAMTLTFIINELSKRAGATSSSAG